jgi:hypothetical protein
MEWNKLDISLVDPANEAVILARLNKIAINPLVRADKKVATIKKFKLPLQNFGNLQQYNHSRCLRN